VFIARSRLDRLQITQLGQSDARGHPTDRAIGHTQPFSNASLVSRLQPRSTFGWMIQRHRSGLSAGKTDGLDFGIASELQRAQHPTR